MSGLANPILPPNLLLGIGLYEQFHSPVAMQQMLQAATGKEPREQQTIGDFATNRARRLARFPPLPII
ncbi:MAG: hypothetical protein HC925_00260 [Coleofasciculaceae cyanobacterium SM2_3_26]|nr:hypothetical protein [Coleofasciculaceae cyanobacterium SM2_3_26]